MFTLVNLLTATALFAIMTALQEAGRRLGEHDRQKLRAGDDRNSTAAEGAVYGLLGLLIAFTFSGAGARYETRHHLVVEEANAIGTAWLRIDLLPSSAQPQLRELFRRYLELRIADSQTPLGNQDIVVKTQALQSDIWTAATAGAKASGAEAPSIVLLPALNAMIDITTTREQARRLHPPAAVFVLLAVLSLVGSLFSGYGLAGTPRRRLHTVGFAGVLSLALFVIIDYEFPRVGLIRVQTAESVFLDRRRLMK